MSTTPTATLSRSELERMIRRLRQAIMRDNVTAAEEADLSARLVAALAELRALPDASPVGPYSGLTRRELAATGTCETDWA